jgi:hypothetical protein
MQALEGRAAMQGVAALLQFVIHDPIGRWLGITWAIAVWFALGAGHRSRSSA